MSRRSQKNFKLVGRVKRNPDGFGFLIPTDPQYEDVYLPRHTMTGIMTDDIVEINRERERDGRYSGEIIGVIERAHAKIVGKFKKAVIGKGGIVLDESKAWGENLLIPEEGLGTAKDNDLVAVEVKSFPGEVGGFCGNIVEVLGVFGDPKIDTKKIIYEKRIPFEFSRQTLKEVDAVPEEVTENDWKGRRDLREKKFVTIDGATARDFDDAVYAEKYRGGFKVWVAIADVSHYVKPGTSLDNDAYNRGTSVYFPDMVVPMLPEKLSNGLCSLNPHLPRLAMVAEINLDHSGHIQEYEIYDAVFMSHHRMIYGEVQEIIDGTDIPKFSDVKDNIMLMSDIAHVLMKKRFHEGSLDLDIPESQIILDAQGNPTDVLRSNRIFAHRLIEEFMLLANIVVAKFISEKKFPSLYRIHEEPLPEKLKDLELMAHNWGVRVRLTGNGMIQKNLMKMLEQMKGKPQETILSILTLRSMKQAQYHQDNKGHFGLGFKYYTHFTSPIRRYPDLIVHRTLKRILNGERLEQRHREEETDTMMQAGLHLSACEQRSTQAERDLIATKRCRFMKDKIGNKYQGMVTGIVKFGFFVQLRDYDVDGLVGMDTLFFDIFMYNDATQKLVGKKTKTVISLGDVVEVKVMRVDEGSREIDFEWINHNYAKPTGERQPTETNSERPWKARIPQRAGKSKAGPVHSEKDFKRGRRKRKAKRR